MTRKLIFGALTMISMAANADVRDDSKQSGPYLGAGLGEVTNKSDGFVLQGWVSYYGRFHRSALYAVFDTLDQYLVRWLRRNYKRLK